MSKYVVSAEAKTDLAEIWEYIADDNLDAADRWIARLREAFESLARAPGIGHKREDLTALLCSFGRWANTWLSIASGVNALKS